MPLTLLQDIKAIVDNFVEKTYYIHSKFVLTEFGGIPVPLRDAEDKYPAVLSQVDSIKFDRTLNNQTISVSVSYLRPCLDDFSDVPETQMHATTAIMDIVYYLSVDERYTIVSDVVVNSVMHKSVDLLGGAVASFLISTTNSYSPCC